MNKYRFMPSMTPGFWIIEDQHGVKVPGTVGKINPTDSSQGFAAELIMFPDHTKAKTFREKGAHVEFGKTVMAVRFTQPTVSAMSTMIDHFVNGTTV